MQKLLVGSGNPGKAMEIRMALASTGIEILTPGDLGMRDSPSETGNTFEENARQKARFYHERSELPALADDSGIFIEALADELGIHTRRWGAGKEATDEEWIAYFLKRMSAEENKRARFLCVLCFIDERGAEHFFRGACDGVITDALEADFLPGLPISACFKPDGFDRVFSALTMEEKNRLSHRGLALRKFISYII